MQGSKLRAILLLAGAVGGLHISFNLLKPFVVPDTSNKKSNEEIMEELRNKIEGRKK